ncbi:Nucleoid occlusion factor SlmA [Curvibacter sp. AEP1-3]|uniref:TetR/AcrR family transcriptional regulator n=1 Tax=Curvibacter sp. AEP1-3 TaxID=1844971 RepID=UPI000B3C83E8|nr:TetR/AcrR family transcriptional regulator [Curvibacter sp. AEP1-3]ARV18514.1 Nucleoid occlusion factor SlmA [Curvibacter sp. AEP1-3]
MTKKKPVDVVDAEGAPVADVSLSLRRAPRQVRAQETVRAVLRAAGEEIESGGLDRLTTNRVAARAGLSIGAVYGYFPNKESILQALLVQWLDGVFEALDSLHPRHGGGLDLIRYLQAQLREGARVYSEQAGLSAMPYLSEGVPALRPVVMEHDARVYASISSALRHYVPTASAEDIDSFSRCLPLLMHAGLVVLVVEKSGEMGSSLEFLRAAIIGMASRLLMVSQTVE